MKFLPAIFLLVLFGTVCLASTNSPGREKRDFFGDIFKGIKKAVKKVDNTVIKGPEYTIDKLSDVGIIKRDFFGDLFRGIKQDVNKVGTKVHNAANTVKTFVNDQVDNAKGAVNKIDKVSDVGIIKRDFFDDLFKGIKKDVQTIGTTVNNAVNTVTTFVNTQVDDAAGTVNTIGKVADLAIKKVGDIVNEGVEFTIGTSDSIAKNVENQLKITVTLEKSPNGKFDELKIASSLERDNIQDDILDDTLSFVTTVVNDGRRSSDYVEKEETKVEEGVEHIAKEAYKMAYEKAHEEFDAIKQLQGKKLFDKAVCLLIHYLGSTADRALCDAACDASADVIFGPEIAPFALFVCAPLCAAALCKLEDIAEGYAEKAVHLKS